MRRDMLLLVALNRSRANRHLSFPKLAADIAAVTGVAVPWSTLYYLCHRLPAPPPTKPTERTLRPIENYLRRLRIRAIRRKAAARRRTGDAPAVEARP